MAIDVDVQGMPSLLAGLYMAGLAAWVLFLNPRGRLHQAMAFLLALRGVTNAGIGLSGSRLFAEARADDPMLLVLGAAELAVPFAALAFAFLYRNRRAGVDPPRAVLWSLLAVTVAVEAWFWSDPTSFARPGFAWGPLYLWVGAKFVAYGVASALLFREGALTRDANLRRALVLVALAMGAAAAYAGAYASLRIGVAPAAGTDPGIVPIVRVLQTLAAVASVWGVWNLWRHARQDAARRREGWGATIVIGAAVLTGLAISLVTLSEPTMGSALFRVGDGLWTLTTPLLLTFALVKHHALGSDAKTRWTVRGSTLAAAGLAAFFVATSILQNFLQEQYNWAFSGLAAGLVVVFARPLERLAERIIQAAKDPADSAVPLTANERTRIYADQARLAWADGSLSRDERKLLDGLRVRLGLSEAEAARIERDASQM